MDKKRQNVTLLVLGGLDEAGTDRIKMDVPDKFKKIRVFFAEK